MNALLYSRNHLVVELGRALVVSFAHGAVEVDSRVVERRLEVSHALQRSLLGVPARLKFREFRFFDLQIVAEFRQTFARGIVLFLLECEFFNREPVDLALKVVNFNRGGFDFHLEAARGFVHEVDGFIGKLSRGNVPIGERCGGDECAVGNRNFVVSFVAFLEAAQDRDRVFDTRLANVHLLESAFESRVLFDELAVFVERGRTDEAKFTSGEHRFEHVGGRDAALTATGTHERVEFVDKGNDGAVGIVDFFEDRFESFLKLTPILGASDES